MPVAYDDAYRIAATGITVVSGGTSASTAVPNAADGQRARFIRLQVTGNLYVKLTFGAGTCTNNDVLLSPNFDVILHTRGYDTISYLQEAVGAKLNITPLES